MHLTLFGSEKYMYIFNRIKYVINDFTYIVSHNFAKIKIDSDDALHLKKTLNMYNVILIKSVFNKNHYHYYYKVILQNVLPS